MNIPMPMPAILLQRIFQVRILKAEILFDARAPSRFVIKVNVSSLLVLVSRNLWFFVTLEPGHVLLVKPPTLFLERPRRKVLLVGALGIVKNKEQTIRSKLIKDGRVVENCGRRHGIGRRCWVRVLRGILAGTILLDRVRRCRKRVIKCAHVRRS